jgi:hypothetical protein
VATLRDDELNFFRERDKRGAKGALAELNKRWRDPGFDDE